jgi:hypothetical protein
VNAFTSIESPAFVFLNKLTLPEKSVTANDPLANEVSTGSGSDRVLTLPIADCPLSLLQSAIG